MGLFKRQVGGTPLGNSLRAITNKLSQGILGNGLLMKKTTTGSVKAPQVVDAITSGFETVNEKMNTDNLTETKKMDLKTKVLEWLQANKMTAMLLAGAVAVGAFLYFRKRKGRR